MAKEGAWWVLSSDVVGGVDVMRVRWSMDEDLRKIGRQAEIMPTLGSTEVHIKTLVRE